MNDIIQGAQPRNETKKKIKKMFSFSFSHEKLERPRLTLIHKYPLEKSERINVEVCPQQPTTNPNRWVSSSSFHSKKKGSEKELREYFERIEDDVGGAPLGSLFVVIENNNKKKRLSKAKENRCR